jgi:hypothetical protein
MARLHDLKQLIDQVIDQRGLDPFKVRGAISLRSGLVIGLIKPDTLDDDDKLRKLREAASQVLGVEL